MKDIWTKRRSKTVSIYGWHDGLQRKFFWIHKKASRTIKESEKMKVKTLSRVWVFVTPWIIAHQAPPSMGFSRQGYQSGLPFPSLGDVPEPGFKPRTPALQADALTSKLLKETQSCRTQDQYTKINCISIDRQQRIRNWSWKI